MTTQHFGRKLSEQGYLNDSMGLGIDPGAIYNVTKEGEEVRTIYRVGIVGKRTPKPLQRKTTSHG